MSSDSTTIICNTIFVKGMLVKTMDDMQSVVVHVEDHAEVLQLHNKIRGVFWLPKTSVISWRWPNENRWNVNLVRHELVENF